MSADNWIIVLTTTRRWKKSGNGRTYREGSTLVHRVAHVQAWENLEYFKENHPWLVGSYLDTIFKRSPVYEDLNEAVAAAHDLMEKVGYVEYGVSVYRFPEFCFLDDV